MSNVNRYMHPVRLMNGVEYLTNKRACKWLVNELVDASGVVVTLGRERWVEPAPARELSDVADLRDDHREVIRSFDAARTTGIDVRVVQRANAAPVAASVLEENKAEFLTRLR